MSDVKYEINKISHPSDVMSRSECKFLLRLLPKIIGWDWYPWQFLLFLPRKEACVYFWTCFMHLTLRIKHEYHISSPAHLRSSRQWIKPFWITEARCFAEDREEARRLFDGAARLAKFALPQVCYSESKSQTSSSPRKSRAKRDHRKRRMRAASRDEAKKSTQWHNTIHTLLEHRIKPSSLSDM